MKNNVYFLLITYVHKSRIKRYIDILASTVQFRNASQIDGSARDSSCLEHFPQQRQLGETEEVQERLDYIYFALNRVRSLT